MPFLLILFFLTACRGPTLQDELSCTPLDPIEQAALEEKISTELEGCAGPKKNSVMLLLDRAMLRFMEGNAKGAAEDFNLALEASDYYRGEKPDEVLLQLTLDDSLTPYRGDDLEMSLARLYMALSLLQIGDKSNALALLKQEEKYYSENNYFNPLATLLFAELLEKQGDFSNAKILYRRLEESFPIGPQEGYQKEGTLLIFHHYGRTPLKITGYYPAERASLAALEVILAANGVRPCLSTLAAVPGPALLFRFPDPCPLRIEIDGVNTPFQGAFDIGAAKSLELEKKLPTILAKVVARRLIRRACIGVVENKNETTGGLLDLAAFIANTCEKADTRSWDILPRLIEVAKVQLPDSPHTLKIIHKGSVVQEVEISLKNNEVAVIHIFHLSDIPTVLVPTKVVSQLHYPSKTNNLLDPS